MDRDRVRPPIEPFAGPAASAGRDDASGERITVEVGGKRLEVVLPAGLGVVGDQAGGAGPARWRGHSGRAARRTAPPGGGRPPAAGGDALVSPMQGTIVKLVAAEGEQVSAGDTVVVLEAMKMEQPLDRAQGRHRDRAGRGGRPDGAGGGVIARLADPAGGTGWLNRLAGTGWLNRPAS